jgi:hypothetical protein
VHRSQVICVVSFVNNGSLPISAATGRLETEATSPFDHSFLLVFNTHYLSSIDPSIVKCAFLVVDYGGMPISTARGVRDRK